MYVARRKNRLTWDYFDKYNYHSGEREKQMTWGEAKQLFKDEFFADKGILIAYSIFWPITVVCHTICLSIYGIFQLIAGGSNSLFVTLDKIIDYLNTPRAKKIKIDKRIVGYSLDEVSPRYPFLIRAKEAAIEYKISNQPIYIHYVDGTHEAVDQNRLKNVSKEEFILDGHTI